MRTWDFDILHQGGFDWWVGVCAVAAGVLLLRFVLERWWLDGDRAVLVPGALLAAAGTVLVVSLRALHQPLVGLVWTFVTVSLVAGLSYYRQRHTLGRGRTGVLLGLRLLALLLLVPMLFRPVLQLIMTHRPERPLMLLVDTSASMSVPDVQQGPTRIASVWQALQPQLDKLRQVYAVRAFAFDSSARELPRVEELAKIAAGGQSTDIARGVSHVLGQTDRTDVAIVLISDGIDNTSGNVVASLSGARRSVHTVWVGSEETKASVSNIAIDAIRADEEMSVGHATKLGVVVKSAELSERVVHVKLAQVDDAGRPVGEVQSKPLVLRSLPEGQVVEMEYTPRTLGVQHLAAWIDPLPVERTAVDNRQEFQALALDPRIKVLYIEGRARPEYRDLNRALQRDANIESASLLRLQQERFAASGTVGGEPLKSMPSSMEEWRRFDVIILGDLDASFLTRAQQEAIERRVEEGGGLLMLGGQSTFGPGLYAGTVVEKILPVLAGGADSPQEKAEFVPRLTREGAMHPAMEGLAPWFGAEEKAPEKKLPPLRGNVVVPRAKSGASVLMVQPERSGPDGRPQIILAAHQFGKGRSAAFTADTTYLWYSELRDMGQDNPYNRFWGQLTRWLAGADVRNRQRGAGLDALLSKSVFTLGEGVTVKAMVRDERGDATRYADVSLRLSLAAASGASKRTADAGSALTPSGAHTGMYELTMPGLPQGDWVAQLEATKDGRSLGQQTLRFQVIAPADELVQLGARPGLLAEISSRTRGYHYPLGQFGELVAQLLRQQAGAQTTRQVSLPLSNVVRSALVAARRPPTWAEKYDLPMQAVLVFVLLAAEWSLRRKWQLP